MRSSAHDDDVGTTSPVEGEPGAPPYLSPLDDLDAQRRGRTARSVASSLLTGKGWVISTLVVDSVLLVLAMLAAFVGARAAGVEAHGVPEVWLFPPMVIALLAVRGMYRQKITLRILDEAGHVVGATSVAAMVIIAIAAFTSTASDSVELVARAWLFSLVYVGGGRLVLGLSQRGARADRLIGKPTLILGAGRIGAQVERRLMEQAELGLRPIGFLDAYAPAVGTGLKRSMPVLGSPDELERVVSETGAEHIVLAFLSSRGSDARLVPIVRRCEELGLEVSLVPRLFESINVRVGLEHIGGMPLFRLRALRPKGWHFAIKYALDRVIAGLLILVLSPVLIALTLAVKLSSPGPVFFRQRRVGRDGRDFDLLKFRSMRVGDDPRLTAPEAGIVLPEDTAPGGVEGVDRRTPIGRFIRRTSLDELPQLFNVVRGEMSVVGPRPERPEFVELFERQIDRYFDRHRVKAGITGWAQVHGLRGKTSLSDRIELDNYYIENWSLRLDFKILLMTVTALFHNAE